MKQVELASLGLYYHIPFCSRLCHYCDFVKTALFDGEHKSLYVDALKRRTEDWFSRWEEWDSDRKCTSVFFGGGTPSLLDQEYEPLFQTLAPHLEEGAEISLEANPEHISRPRLDIWKSLGINRLSLGVQSFQEAGLKFLTREHSPSEAAVAVSLARELIANVNIDLIYGWPGQTVSMWKDDLERALALGATHLSLYSLTYEGHTPIARRVQRGVLSPAADDALVELYELACERMARAGMIHEEVSNWALPGFQSRHNSLYWHGSNYIGIGSGSHSYLNSLGPWGQRWKQNSSWRSFAAVKPEPRRPSCLDELLGFSDYELEEDRDAEAYILETISSSLRTLRGVNLDALCKKTGYIWKPRPSVVKAFEGQLLTLDAGGQLKLRESEWFRESAWALELSLSLEKGIS